MPQQLAFAGFGAAPPLTDSLFFAFLPDAAARARIVELTQRLRDKYALKGRPQSADRLHVSLHHIGEYSKFPDDIAARAMEVAGQIDVSPFDVSFDGVMSFSGNPKSLPLALCGGEGVAPVVALHQTLGSTMQRADLGRAKSGKPHITLLYDERRIDAQPVEPIGWTAREFVLIHSLLGRGEYRALGRWSLCG